MTVSNSVRRALGCGSEELRRARAGLGRRWSFPETIRCRSSPDLGGRIRGFDSAAGFVGHLASNARGTVARFPRTVDQFPGVCYADGPPTCRNRRARQRLIRCCAPDELAGHADRPLGSRIRCVAGPHERILQKIGRLRRNGLRVDESEWRQPAHLLGIDNVEVLRIPSAITPMAVGVLRPAILIPSDATQWTAERRRVVLLHELAHVRRRDPAVHIAARLALCLYWWNPAAWAAWWEMLKERERAADDAVLGAGSRASDYAAHLLDIARSMRDVPGIAPTAICMARKSQLEGRLLAILDNTRRRSIPGAVTAIAAMVLAIAVTIPLAAVRAQDTAQNRTTTASLIEWADAVRRSDRLPEAEARYREVAARIGNRPEAAPAFIGLGITALARKDPAQAIEHFETAQKLDPSNDGTALMWLGIAETRRDNASQAEAYYRSALSRLDPNSAQAATVMELCAALLQAEGRSPRRRNWSSVRPRCEMRSARRRARNPIQASPSTAPA